MKTTDKVNLLFDYAVRHQGGFTYEDIERDLHWRRPELFRIANRLRAVCGDDEKINLICEPQGQGPWRYKLIGDFSDAKVWGKNRVGDCKARIMTVLAVLNSVVAATDGRTHDGRQARIMHRSLTRLVEDLVELDRGSPLFKV
jgi:hypothetical protein